MSLHITHDAKLILLSCTQVSYFFFYPLKPSIHMRILLTVLQLFVMLLVWRI